MLDKPEFDCNNLGEFYDCGCSDDEEGSGGESTNKEAQSTAHSGDTSSSHNDLHDHLAVEISKEASVSLSLFNLVKLVAPLSMTY